MEKDLFALIYSDFRRYRCTGQSSAIEVILFTQGLWASTVYRVARAIFLHVHIPVIRQVLRLLSKFAQKLMEIITGVSLPVGCEIGEGLYIGHFGPVILHPKTRIGKNCNLSQGVTIGIVQRGKRAGVPVLGDRIFVGPNAIVIGGITIGEDAAIGAGAIVTHSVPARGVVVGNPARVISHQGSFDFVRYDGMEDDPARTASSQFVQESEVSDGSV